MQFEITPWLLKNEQDRRVLMIVHRAGRVEIDTLSWAEDRAGRQSLGPRRLERMTPRENG